MNQGHSAKGITLAINKKAKGITLSLTIIFL